ncbi:hypothetical protein [Citreimonas sp.]|uniref:hypothetical protein n=1 Tax=Citreimonas sp. TaxID=3036715 RepID=UPI0035C85639
MLLLGMARYRTGVSVGYMIAGIVLLMAAYILRIHAVEFNGEVAGGQIGGLDPETTKQVGYIWAPNWALASIFILPLAIYNLLAARASAESILPLLLERKMIVRRDGAATDGKALQEAWRRTAASWSVFTLICLLGVAVFIILADFLPVVGNWLSSEPFRATELPGITIADPDYEFDWSIAALYPSEDVSWQLNYAFSLSVYVLVPIIGAGLIFGLFIWFASISTFFSVGQLRAEGYVVVPDIDSDDERRGFEVFEELFDSLLRAGLMTAAMALCMHYQNVFLRSPSHENILEMLFADSVGVAGSALDGDFSPLMSYFTGFDSIVHIENCSISLQTYATALVNMLIFVIIIGLMWRWLRKLATGGLEYTARHIPVTKRQKAKLLTMQVWPVGWMSETLLSLVIVLTLAAMYYINLLPLLLFVLVLYGIKSLISAAIPSFGGSFAARRNFVWRDADDEDDDAS